MGAIDVAPASEHEADSLAGRVDRRLQDLEEQVRDLDRRVENNRLIRDTWTLIIFAIAAIALLASIIAVGFAMRAIDEAEHATAATFTAAGAVT